MCTKPIKEGIMWIQYNLCLVLHSEGKKSEWVLVGNVLHNGDITNLKHALKTVTSNLLVSFKGTGVLHCT